MSAVAEPHTVALPRAHTPKRPTHTHKRPIFAQTSPTYNQKRPTFEDHLIIVLHYLEVWHDLIKCAPPSSCICYTVPKNILQQCSREEKSTE